MHTIPASDIPLRLVLTTICNGNCSYCHHEGYLPYGEMPFPIILDCAQFAHQYHLARISLTGGEPSLRSDLSLILNQIKTTAPATELSLTTNGYRLLRVIPFLEQEIDLLNISLASLKPNVSLKYQGVSLQDALCSLIDFPAKLKVINVVVTQDNYKEIQAFIDLCVHNNVSLDIIFQLKEETKQDISIRNEVFYGLKQYSFKLVFNPYPVLSSAITSNTTLRIKNPILSTITQRPICLECVHKPTCYERVCCVRVYPDGNVSPCLNSYIRSNKPDLSSKIFEIYDLLNPSYEI